jgi:transposase
MSRYDIPDDLWNKIEPWLETIGRDPRGAKNKTSNQHIFNSVLYRMRTGIPWRDLPERYGPWQTIYRRLRHWMAHGCWAKLFKEVTKFYDDEALVIDSSFVKLSQAGTGAKGGTSNKRLAGQKAD